MPRFSIRNPYFIVVLCLAIAVFAINGILRMPVDLFPPINLPEVVVATFYSGMPPQDIEVAITNPLERFFTQASGYDHMESRSMLGVSIIKVFFQPGTNADSDVTQLSNLALADLKRLPPGTLPPLVMKFDASSLPVCLVTVKGEGLNETQLHDLSQFQIRNQIARVNGAEIPAVFGGKYRQAMIYVDPLKLLSRQLSVMDVVDAVNSSNLILPAGDVKIGPTDYYVYSNSLVQNVQDLDSVPIKTVGTQWVSVGDVGEAKDASQLQYNIVRIDGQKSAYIPIMKSGGDSNTIQVVNDVRELVSKLFDLPAQLKTDIVFDQSVFVKQALKTVLHEGLIGLALTSLMILLFLGSMRATGAVLLSIPISALATFVVLYMLGSTINTMILGGLALAFSRVIDNSVISLENIYRHLEMGSSPAVAAEEGGAEVNLAVLAATLVDVVDFFPVTFLFGVSKFLFSALALAFCLALLASFVVAMTVIPLFCSRYLKGVPGGAGEEHRDHSWGGRFNAWFNRGFNGLLDFYERSVRRTLKRPGLTLALLLGVFVASLAIYPLLGRAFFPRTDAGQFTVNVKVPTGSRLEVTNDYVAKIEDLIRQDVPPKDLKMVLSNIGVVNDISALYTSNAGMYTATIQVGLNEGHEGSSFDYMDRVKADMAANFPDVRTFFQSGSMQDAILNQGQPAPIDVQVNTGDLNLTYSTAQDLARRIRELPGVGQIYIPQDMNYPSVRMDIDRVHAGELGLSQKDVVDNVITALNSNIMIAPNYWVDYKTGNDYFLSVQYAEHGKPAIHNMVDLKQIPLRAPNLKNPTTLDSVVKLVNLQSPTEVDHYQIQRVVDIYVTPVAEDLAKLRKGIVQTIADARLPSNIRVTLRGMVDSMDRSFTSFALGFSISFILLFLILVAQFKSWIDPFLIMLAIPMGFVGVLIILPLTHTTMNVMSLMGVLMLIGIADSNSILIVDFAHKLEEQGMSVRDAVVTACRVRLRPILMTSMATIIGMIPMAMKLGEGGEQYTPMARAIIGGLTSSVLLTVFIVPAAYLLVYGRKIEMLLGINNRFIVLAAFILACAQSAIAQAPPAQKPRQAPTLPRLTLQEAEAMAIQNHPQIQAAQNEVNYANQQIVENRSSFYPNVTGDITGSQGNDLSRIGAGDISASRLFDRFGQGVVVRQLISDFGRTSSLVANSRLQAQAAAQTSQATRDDVLVQVTRSYFDVLRSQAVVKVAEETISARQLLSDQVTELARNGLRSQLDVGFADVNVSEAKLLLIRAQGAVQQALAELGRAMGSDEPANYQLADEPLPAGPPPTADALVAQALGNRPEIAGLRFSRDAAYKFADAEKDLSHPTVSAVAVGGLIPYINTPASSPIPLEYEGIAANVSIPLFNGHLFAARREAAAQRAMESDQRVRDEQQQISRDVRVAWAGAYDAFQRIDVTAEFLRYAANALSLAQGRYDNGLADIVVLTQAQLSLTQAEIENLNAKYDYQTQNAALQYAIGLLR